jgi:CRP/FNR family transcriptional regulator, cyclic AMP receptor protein
VANDWCTRILAPAGRLRLSASALLNDSGEPDTIAESDQQHAVQDLPEETLVFFDNSESSSVVSKAGKEAVVGLLKRGDFLGEGCLAGQSRRMATATALTPTTLLILDRQDMIARLHDNPAFSDRFLSQMLARNMRIEENLVDQLFNSSKKRLARALLLLARYGEEEQPQRVLPKLSQELLAEMIGTTRSRVNFFMNKFRKLGFIEYNGGLKIDSSLLSVVLHD